MTRDQAQQFVRATPFARLADLVAPAIAIRRRPIHAKPAPPKRANWWNRLLAPATVGPAIELAPVFDELTLPIGASRFDPVPDVPIGFEWPCAPDGTMLECLAQVDLAVASRGAPATRLPRDGWLLFFQGMDDSPLGQVHHRVIHLPPGPLVRWSTPVPRLHTRRACRLDFDNVWTLPDSHDWCIEQRRPVSRTETEAYLRLQDKLADDARHYLLGHPRAVQGDVRAEAVHDQSDESGAGLSWEECGRLGDGWPLLLQLDSDDADDGPGWMWGDVGTIYFVIRNDDLSAGRFERCRLVMQCC